MITCLECIERFLPDDPRIRSGLYRKCSCDYCGKSSYDRELEVRESTPVVIEHIHRHSDMGKKEFNLLQQTANELKHHIESHFATKKPPPQGYRNIKG